MPPSASDRPTLQIKRFAAPLTISDEGAPEGSVKAAFSRFDELDTDGDVVLASAFTDGQTVPLVWAHQWDQPIGKGVVRVDHDGKAAIFDGRFFLETTAGREAHALVKAMGGIQEWSWGFRTLESEPGQFQGKSARFLKRVEVFEVSPVLVGANRNTETLAIKSAMSASDEDVAAAVEAAADAALTALTAADAPEDEAKAAEGLTEAAELKYADHGDRVLVAAEAFTARTVALRDLRAKAGRAISAANRQRLQSLREQLLATCDQLESLLGETEPAEPTPADGKSDEAATAEARRKRLAQRTRELALLA